MPYHLSEDKLTVLKEDGTPVGKPHKTPKEAQAHLAALEANVSDAKGLRFFKQMEGMSTMGGAEYARQEAWDVATAAAVLSQVASMIMNEADEPDDVKSLTTIIRSLMEFIDGELKEMEKASRRGDNYSKSSGGQFSGVIVEREGKESFTPAQVKTYDINPVYVKSIKPDFPLDKLAVKYVGKNVIAHPVFIWGNPQQTDLEVEFFKRESNFWDGVLKDTPRPLTWDHAQDEQFNHFESDPVIGKTVKYYDDDIARWAESIIETDKKYRRYIDQFIEEKRLGYSSDTAPQYVIREQQGKAIWLKQWPWFGGALTVSPCEPRMKTLYTPEYLKSFGIVLPDVVDYLPRLDSLKRQSEILKLKGKGL